MGCRSKEAATAFGDRLSLTMLDSPTDVKGEPMRAARKQEKPSDEMRAEYDFSAGVRGKYAARFGRASNVVVLAPDVAGVFKTAKAVNDALRTQLRKKPAGKTKRRQASR